MRRLDWFGRVTWDPAEAAVRLPRGVTPEDLGRSAYLEDDLGETHEGFFAIRKLLLHLPALAPLGLLMWLPLVHRIGVPLYGLVARNRCRIPGSAPHG